MHCWLSQKWWHHQGFCGWLMFGLCPIGGASLCMILIWICASLLMRLLTWSMEVVGRCFRMVGCSLGCRGRWLGRCLGICLKDHGRGELCLWIPQIICLLLEELGNYTTVNVICKWILVYHRKVKNYWKVQEKEGTPQKFLHCYQAACQWQRL